MLAVQPYLFTEGEAPDGSADEVARAAPSLLLAEIGELEGGPRERDCRHMPSNVALKVDSARFGESAYRSVDGLPTEW